MRKLIVLFFLMQFGYSSILSQELVKPEYYGTYAVVNGQLVEFPKDSATNVVGVGNLLKTNLGIRDLKGPWLRDSTLYFVIYGDMSKLILSRVEWRNTVESKNPMTGVVSAVQAKMYVAVENIELKVAPYGNINNCIKLVPAKALKEGYYCIHTGRLTSDNAINMTVEANAKKDVFDFTVTEGFIKKGDMSKCDIEKGEYIKPTYYGLWAIENKKYIYIPVTKSKEITTYLNNNKKNKGLLSITPVNLEASNLEKTIISYSYENARKGIKIGLSNASYKDMVPEKMFLSKLKQIEVDTRSKKDIKKNKPPKMEKIWVEDYQITYNVSITSFYYPRIARIYFENHLEPGIYALHNGALKGQSLSFGTSNVIYSFSVK